MDGNYDTDFIRPYGGAGTTLMYNLSEKESEGYTKDMQEILEFANMINEVNTEGLNETIAANEKCNVLRKDEVRNFANRELLLQNAPCQDEGLFRIPKVLN